MPPKKSNIFSRNKKKIIAGVALTAGLVTAAVFRENIKKEMMDIYSKRNKVKEVPPAVEKAIEKIVVKETSFIKDSDIVMSNAGLAAQKRMRDRQAKKEIEKVQMQRIKEHRARVKAAKPKTNSNLKK
jgi:hypothetical protein